jgi:hypothetical protein
MNAKPKSRSKKLPLLLTLGASALLIGGGAVTYWLVSRQGRLSVMPVGANVVPQDALVVVSVSTEPDQWERLRSFGTPRSQATFDQNLAQFRDRFLTRRGLEFQRDVQPWVGKEVTLAVLSPQLGVTIPSPSQPALPATSEPMIMVLPIDDPVKAKAVLDQSSATKTGQWSTRKYKGVDIREMLGSPDQSASIAALDAQLVLVANTPNAIDRAIDTYKGGKALSSTPGYGDALGQINTERSLARIYVNIPALVNSSATNSNRPVPSQGLMNQLQQNQGLAATATLEPDGIQFKTVWWLTPDSKQRFEGKNNAKMMPSRLPAETLRMASGSDLKQFWQEFTQGASSSLVRYIFPQGLLSNPEKLRQGIKSAVNLDLEDDLLNWMQGEFSLALIPSAQKSATNSPTSLVFMVQSNDRRTAEKALKQLDDVMASKYTFKVEEARIEGQSVVNWSLPTGDVSVTHGWLDGDVAFLSLNLVTPATPSFLPKPANPLSESEAFRKVTKTTLERTNGHFFMDVDRALSLNNFFPLLQLPPMNRTVLEATQSIGVTSAVTSDRTTRYDIFVTLQKGNKPGALPSPNASAIEGASPSPLPSASPSP